MRKALPFALKGLVVAGLLAAVFDVSLPTGHFPRTRVYLLDISASVQVTGEPDSLRPADGWKILREDAGRFDRVIVILFGGSPETIFNGPPEELPLAPPEFPRPEETDPGEALEAALAYNPDDVVLLSDGHGGRVRLKKALLFCSNRNIPVHTIALGPRSPADTRITAIRAPMRVPPGREFTLEVDLLSTLDSKITLTLDGIRKKTADLVRQQPRTLSFPGLRISERTRLVVEISPPDACPENNRAEWLVEPETDRRRILLLQSSPSGLSPLLKADPSLSLVATDQYQDPLGYDLVILDSFPAEKLSREQQERINRFVTQAGGGLLMMGGSGSFASGGYAGGPVEEILPLWAFPEETLSTVILLDRSGSMAASAPGMNRRKLDAAIDAIQKVLSTLRPEVRATIITFAGDRKVLGPLSISRERLLEKLSREEVGGPTALLPALREGIRLLQETTTPRKTLILLTDGNTEEPVSEFTGLKTELQEGGIQLLCIHTGEEAGAALPALAPPHPVSHWSKLSRQIMDWMKESEELVISPSVPSAKLGMPARINRVSLKETATLIASCGDHPLLAMRPAGKGRTAAATFALRKGWTGKLTPPGKTLRELIDLLSPSPLSPYHLAAEINDEGITITARGPQTGPIELHVEFHHFPGGGKGSVNLDQVSATTWQKRIPHPEPGVVWFKPVGFRGGNIALPIPYSLEYTRLGPDRNQLEEISRTTSGVPVRKLGDLNAGPGRKTKWQSGRTPFLIGVILLFLLDLAISAFWKPTRQIQIIKR